ncbi:MAG: hypothetical protein P4L64_17695 [Caulobacteraceae bacterium]|nr:hypothetical protein [Caulobacteraceae bacterium]
MSKSLMVAGVVLAGAAGLAACHPLRQALHLRSDRPMTVAASLTCPPVQGRLIRVSTDADGQACAYRGQNDDAITLTRLDLNGRSPRDALAGAEGQLRSQMSSAPVSSEPPGAPTDRDHGDHAKVDLPFVHVDADNDRAHVQVFGVSIDADNDNAHVNTNWGSKHAVIKAGPEGAEIRAEDIRKGDANLVYILASDEPGPSGYRSLGYIARGPANGPLVVATFKSKAEHHHDIHNHDLDQLIALNITQ